MVLFGKRRFEAALAEFEHREDVASRGAASSLTPTLRASGAGIAASAWPASTRSASSAHSEIQQQLTDVAAGEGLSFRFDIARSGSTFDAHRLVHLAREHGLQDATKERLLRAYLSEGELMSDHATLLRLALDAGLPEPAVSETLAGERFADEVRDDERTAAQLGISAVPTFVIDRAIGALRRAVAAGAARAAAPGLGPPRRRVRRRRRGSGGRRGLAPGAGTGESMCPRATSPAKLIAALTVVLALAVPGRTGERRPQAPTHVPLRAHPVSRRRPDPRVRGRQRVRRRPSRCLAR